MADILPFDPTIEFPLFEAGGAGDFENRARLTMLCIKQTIPNMRDLADALGLKPDVVRIEDFIRGEDDARAAKQLGELLLRYGSDKASIHNYHLIYGPILKDVAGNGILEIGIGSNNPTILSNMGVHHVPGGSLRAFRDFTNVNVFGADIDRDICIHEDRIRTYFVDQTRADTLETLGNALPHDLDLVIDDGLHAPNANLATLKFGLGKVRRGGWVIVEDIGPTHIPIWQVVHAFMSRVYKCYLIKSRAAHMFLVQNQAPY